MADLDETVKGDMRLRASPSAPQVQDGAPKTPMIWHRIDSAPEGVEVIIAVFRDDFEDPIIQNSILLDGEERGKYWSDWHGMPAPTHWTPLVRPEAI